MLVCGKIYNLTVSQPGKRASPQALKRGNHVLVLVHGVCLLHTRALILHPSWPDPSTHLPLTLHLTSHHTNNLPTMSIIGNDRWEGLSDP